jgi:hypothetical protein
MIPIYEQGSGNGIGHGLDSFLNLFDCICSEHRKEGRAKAFAFIFMILRIRRFAIFLKIRVCLQSLIGYLVKN